MKLGVLCSGQGLQDFRMTDFLKDNKEACEIISFASEVLQTDLFNLNESIDIFENSFAQPYICSFQLAIYHAIKNHIPEVSVLAGYSLGELSIYACNESLDYKETILLAKKRAEIMDKSNPNETGLLSCQNLSYECASSLCKDSNTFISIINVENHFIIGGKFEDLYTFENLALKMKANIKVIKVKLASHTPLLKDASKSFFKDLKNSSFKNPSIVSISSISSDFIYTKEDAMRTLSSQISQTIQWEASLESLLEYGCDTVLELGPGNALSKMVKKLNSEIEVRSVSDFKTLEGVINWVNKRN